MPVSRLVPRSIGRIDREAIEARRTAEDLARRPERIKQRAPAEVFVADRLAHNTKAVKSQLAQLGDCERLAEGIVPPELMTLWLAMERLRLTYDNHGSRADLAEHARPEIKAAFAATLGFMNNVLKTQPDTPYKARLARRLAAASSASALSYREMSQLAFAFTGTDPHGKERKSKVAWAWSDEWLLPVAGDLDKEYFVRAAPIPAYVMGIIDVPTLADGDMKKRQEFASHDRGHAWLMNRRYFSLTPAERIAAVRAALLEARAVWQVVDSLAPEERTFVIDRLFVATHERGEHLTMTTLARARRKHSPQHTEEKPALTFQAGPDILYPAATVRDREALEQMSTAFVPLAGAQINTIDDMYFNRYPLPKAFLENAENMTFSNAGLLVTTGMLPAALIETYRSRAEKSSSEDAKFFLAQLAQLKERGPQYYPVTMPKALLSTTDTDVLERSALRGDFKDKIAVVRNPHAPVSLLYGMFTKLRPGMRSGRASLGDRLLLAHLIDVARERLGAPSPH